MEGRKVRGECERIKGAKGKEGGGRGSMVGSMEQRK